MTVHYPREVGPVTDRFLVLQLVRVFVAIALCTVPAITGDFHIVLLPLAFAYATVIGAVELVRRHAPRLDPTLVWSSVLVDGVVLAIAVARTGGYMSPLVFLVFLEVAAATLLVSYRTGLKFALWCALLLMLAYAAADADVFGTKPTVGDRFALVSAATFLVFAIGAAAFSAVNERSLRHSRAQLESLVELGTELQHAHRADEGMSALIRHACRRLGFARAVVLTRRGDGWRGVCYDGLVESVVEAGARDLPELESSAYASPQLVRSLDENGLLDLLLPDARNVVIVPVVADDEYFGLVAAEWGGYDDDRIPVLTVQGLSQAAMHTASALHNAALLDEVERLATRDSLTGIANRRLFDESLARESARAQRLGAPLSLIVFDVDHFKQINDTYGHMTGDAVLHEVAQAMVTTTKSYDVAARYGGDEFMLLLPGCSSKDAVGVAERVRAEIIRRANFVPVSVSAGLATVPDNALDGDRLVAAADAALYEAKRAGRDRVLASARVAGGAVPTAVRLNETPLARGA
ncbi:MAG TPA: GGDEF domain-containing protein [Acidimicrobiia bacterium]|nr:GGDEF domain-containing protein [Acidimicrobiia bacterium]